MSDLTIDGTTPDNITVDGSSVSELYVDGSRVWPKTIGTMNATSQSFTGSTSYGFCGSCSPSHGSLSGDSTLNGSAIVQLRWLDFDSGTDTFRLATAGTIPQNSFKFIKIQTDFGEQKFYASSADTSGDGFWYWNEASKLFTNGQSYDYVIV